MINELDNPAARLTSILELANEIDAKEVCVSGWARVFNLDNTRDPEIYEQLAEVMRLPAQVEHLIKLHFPSQVRSVPHWKNPIDTSFNGMNLKSDWNSFKGNINDNCIVQLRLIAELLGTKLNSKFAAETDVNNLCQQLAALIEAVQLSTTSDSVKLHLIDELTKLLVMLRRYRITGAEPILKQVDAMFGRAIRDPGYRSFLVDEELGQRLVDSLSAMANLLTVAIGLPQLSVAITGLLR